MLKRNAIVKFVFLAIIAILGILLCVCPFSVPYSSQHYNGFLGAINKGVDLDGGVSAIYDCTLPFGSDGKLTNAIDNSLSKINDIFKNEGFSQLYVERQGGKIKILTSSDAFVMNKAFHYIAEGKEISFTSAQVSENLTSPEVYVKSEDIKSVKPDYSYDSNSYGVTIEFSQKGKEKLDNLKKIADKTANKKIYIYLGEVQSNSYLAELETKNVGSTIFITASKDGGYSTTSADEARAIAYSIAGGMLDVEMELIEVSQISALFGKNTLLFIGICLIVTAILTFVLLCVRYGELGLVGSLALVFYSVLFAFFMQAIPFITLTLSGVIGSIVAFIFAAICVTIIFEKIREEYAIGKKIHLSCKGGFKKALWTIIDFNMVVILASAFIWIFAPVSMKCFAITLILGSLLSIFTSLIILRGLVNNYLSINSTKPKRMRLYRDKNVKEIKDENVQIIENKGEENLPIQEEVSND